MLVPTLGNFSLAEPRSVVVMDNARVHNPADVEDLVTAAGAKIIWTAAYSPELNPIERCFALYKKWIQRYRTYFGADVVLRHMTALHESVSRDTIINFMGGRAFEGCIRNLPIVSISNEHEDSDRKRRRDEEAVVLMMLGLVDGPLNWRKRRRRRGNA